MDFSPLVSDARILESSKIPCHTRIKIKEIRRKKKELGANNFSNLCLFAMLADFTYVREFGLFSNTLKSTRSTAINFLEKFVF